MAGRLPAVRLGLIALFAFALRAAWALAVAPESLNHTGDARFFHLSANLLAEGHGFIAPLPFLEGGTELPSSEHPPGWPALLAVFSLAGADGYTAHELVGSGVGAGIVVCAGLLGRRVGGERSGLIAAGIAAVYPVYVALDGSLMSEPPYALGVAICLLLAFRAIDRPTLPRAALLGIAIGATALVRTEALGLLVILAVPIVLGRRERRLARVALVWVAAALVVAPWVARNMATFDQPMLISTEDGPVIAGANCDLAYHGRDTGYWHSACVGLRGERNPAVRSDRLRAQGLRYAREHAARLPAVEAVRLLRTFGLWQPVRHVYFAEGRAMPGRPLAVACAWVVLALGVTGAIALRRRRVELVVLLAPVALAVATTLIAFGYSRFRYAADVAFVVLAAVLIDRLLRRRTTPPRAV